jgi:UDP-N-acetylmuramoylalanine--D-glutamate ligase
MFAAQRSSDFAVLNADDAATREIGESILPARRIWFTRSPAPPDSGPAAWIQDGVVCVRLSAESDPMPVIEPSQLPASLSGRHSLENVLGAAAAVCALGCRAEAAAEAVRQFGGVPHRMEIVTERLGVRYINNSMCTNVAASVSSLESLDRPAVVIAGGADKGLDYAALTPALAAHAKHLILIGEAAAKMENVFREGGYSAISRAADMASAVACARSIAIPGDAVLLCPTCASFDMFRDFEARGAAFRTAVLSLTEGPQ